jgi:hypothetical protein
MAGAAVLMGGCASTDSVKQAQATADQALSAAQHAQGTADQALAAANGAQQSVDQLRTEQQQQTTMHRGQRG